MVRPDHKDPGSQMAPTGTDLFRGGERRSILGGIWIIGPGTSLRKEQLVTTAVPRTGGSRGWRWR